MPGSTIANGKITSRLGSSANRTIANDLVIVDRVYDSALEPFRKNFQPIIEHLNCYRGKKLRPTLLLLSGLACGRIQPEHHTLGAVVELIHTATLLHDDVLDHATMRRHSQTLNSVWGQDTSILLGDMLFSTAFRLCSSVDATACEWIGDSTNRVCSGELLQISNSGNWQTDEATYFEIIAGKTAALTAVSARLGAAYSRTPQYSDCFADFGHNLGIAFQIADDLLDLEGDDQVAGKTLGTDLAQGKLTLPLIRMLGELSSREVEAMKQASIRGEFAIILDKLRVSGSLDSARSEARNYISKAIDSLRNIPPSSAKQTLEELARWSINRSK